MFVYVVLASEDCEGEDIIGLFERLPRARSAALRTGSCERDKPGEWVREARTADCEVERYKDGMYHVSIQRHKVQ